MSASAHRGCRNLRCGLMLALLAPLVPALSNAAPPLDVPALDVPALDATTPHASLPDGAPRPRAGGGKTRIGRIFFSPAERRRRHAEREHPATDALSANDAPRKERLVIDGAVSSSTEGRAVWVNGTAIEKSAKPKSAWTDSAGTVWLRDDRLIPRSVRPGQAIDPASGAIDDLLPAGSVTQH
jgi:hypothetical protein